MTGNNLEVWAVTAYEGCGCSGGISIVSLHTTEAKAEAARVEKIDQRFAEDQARTAKAKAAGRNFVQPQTRESFEEHFSVEGPYYPDAEDQDPVEPPC